MSIKKVKLGSQGLVVPEIGLGCMGMTKIAQLDIYGQADEKEAIATIHRSLEFGLPTVHYISEQLNVSPNYLSE
jgi:aryl-alcohol dehydrogenase-like predicted oxidoreductase